MNDSYKLYQQKPMGFSMPNQPVSIDEAARLLEQELFGRGPRNPDIIGTILGRDDSPPYAEWLGVTVNAAAAIAPQIPSEIGGHKIRIIPGNQPIFA